MSKIHTFKLRGSQNIFLFVCMCAMAFALAGCDLTQNALKTDREGDLEFQDYRDGLASRITDQEEDKKVAEGIIPDLQPYIAQKTGMKSMPLVSISINQSVPLRDALFELAEQANVDIELDPNIRGSVIFTARNRPFDQVIERLSDIAGLRYKFEDDILRVEVDEPYGQVYRIDYLSYIRNSKSEISNNISVVSGDGNDSGSNFASNAQSEINFWGELETNLEQIIRGNHTGALKTRRDPRIVATQQNPDVQAVAPTANGDNVTVQAPEATLTVESLPMEDESMNSSTSTEAEPNLGTFTINKQAGLINVFATERAHKEVTAYMKLLKKAVTSQVLIEAKILEVTLDDQYVTGIDWSAIDLFSGEMVLDFLTGATTRVGAGLVTDPLDPLGGLKVADTLVPSTAATLNQLDGSAIGPGAVIGYTGNNVQALVEAVSGFGTVKALASPRLTVLNNQSAVLNVATNRVFFEIDIDVTQDGGGGTQTDVESEIRNVPEGVLVNVQPSINLDDRTISLALRPTITSVVDTINDPAVALVVAGCGAPCSGITSPVPELNVQEIDSVIKVRSGQPIVMGGLLQDRIQSSEEGIPVLGETPLIGGLFKDRADRVNKTELVIFLEATILDAPGDSVHNTDKDLYRQFSQDRRPLRF